MVRLATEEETAWEIHTAYEDHVIRLWVAEEDTVEDVKAFLASWKGEEWEVYADEMRVECQGEVVLEGVPLSAVASSPLVLSEDTAGEVVWWAQEVPQRYVIRQERMVGSLESLESLEDLEVDVGGGGGGGRSGDNVILDLRFLSCDPRRIRSWLYGARDITEIWILGTHPEVVEILYAVAEDVRCLPRLQRIHLQHPSDAGFLLPPRSGRRMKRFGGSGDRGSRVTSEVLSYLTQHLQMDAYRVGDEVEIWVDAGVMANGAERGSHRLLVYP